MANTSIFNAFERFWQHIVVALGNKSDISHEHDDRYYTESEIDEMMSNIDTSAGDLNEINTTLEGINTDLNTIFENLETLNTNVSGVIGEVDGLNERVTELENNGGGGGSAATSYLYLPPTQDNLDYANAILIGEVEYDELCDTNGDGVITIGDLNNMNTAMNDASIMANWPYATPSEVTVVATEGGLIASGFNMWGAFVERHISF